MVYTLKEDLSIVRPLYCITRQANQSVHKATQGVEGSVDKEAVKKRPKKGAGKEAEGFPAPFFGLFLAASLSTKAIQANVHRTKPTKYKS